jgi:hypothetical protein
VNGFDHYIDHHADRELSGLKSLKVKRTLADDWGCITGKAARRMIEGTQVSGIVWPPLQELRKKFEERHGPQVWLVDSDKWLDDACNLI